jgi:uncharacterized Zn-finger protein
MRLQDFSYIVSILQLRESQWSKRTPNNRFPFFFFIDHTELCDWLTDSLVNQELNESISQSCFEFVTTDYNELSQESLEHRERKMKITTLVCDECGKSFSRLDSLKRHEKLYCKNKRRCCPHCGKTFEKLLSLHNHIKSDHPS